MRYSVLSCVAALAACGGPGGGDQAAEPDARFTIAQFMDDCKAFHDSDLATVPSDTTSEAFCRCVLDEMNATTADAFDAISGASGEEIGDGVETAYASDIVADQAQNYRTSLRLNKTAKFGDKDFDTAANATESVAFSTCYMRLDEG